MHYTFMDYKLPNLHLIMDGFDRLLEPLVDFEISTLKRHYGEKNWWKAGVLNTLRGSYREHVEGKFTDAERRGSIDIGCALILMFADWDRVFRNYTVDMPPGLVKKARDLANQLFELRNEYSHHKTVDFGPFETKQGLQRMAVLCRCFDEGVASEITGLTMKIGKNAESTAPTVKESSSVPKTEEKKEEKPVEVPAAAEPADLFLKFEGDRPADVGDVVKACMKSAEDLLLFDTLQTHGKRDNESVIHIESARPSGTNSLICRITEALVDNSDYTLFINNRPFPGEQAEITYYDRDEHAIVIEFGEEAMSFYHSQETPEVKLIGDLSFLVKNVHEFYEKYGDMFRYPEPGPVFARGDYMYPTSRSPTDSQKDAIDTILNSGLSYVWGAPGTGKTQMALATALIACVSRGQKVAVVAPTNLAVEQVLRGLISMISENPEFRKIVDPSRDILRLGMASEEFLREYPEVCETKIMQSVIDRKYYQLDRLVDVPFERELPRISEMLKEQQILVKQRDDCVDPVQLQQLKNKILANAESFREFFSFYGKLHFVGNNNGFITASDVDSAYRFVIEHNTLNKDIVDYFDWTDEALDNAIARLYQDISVLSEMKSKVDNLNAKIIALTPHNYLSRFVPRGYHGAKHMKKYFDVDHIFLDEAGYCSAILALPLLANGVPLTLLGDHMQLPPVCSANLEKIMQVREANPEAFKDPEFMKYWYLWEISSIYLDTLFLHDVPHIEEVHDMRLPPICRDMKIATLKESYRFGRNLGEILDRTVYKNGITGIPGNNLQIDVIDVRSPTGNQVRLKKTDGKIRVQRTNVCEVEAVKNYLEANPMDRSRFAILVPYRDQVLEMNRQIPECAFKNILTVHRSQGREWDTVILSVTDGQHTESLDHPRRFTSIFDDGLNLINTAVSRAKKRLIIFCDTGYWNLQKDELVTMLINERESFPHTISD